MPVASRLPADFSTNAAHALYAIDIPRDRAFVVHVQPADYRSASFLDARALRPSMGGWEVTRQALAAALPAAPAGGTAWLFHMGHTGSTFASRCLDLLPGVLGLREPLPLLALAHERNHPAAPAWLALVRTALARTLPGHPCVVVKPTSLVTVLAGRLLQAPDTRGALLWSRLEHWLASLLRDATLVRDVLATAAARGMQGPLPDDPVAALAQVWLHEQQRWEALAAAPGWAGRLAEAEFDPTTGDPRPAVARLARHFGLDVPEDFEMRIEAAGLLQRDAKRPQQRHDPAQRRAVLAQVHAEHGGAIERAVQAAERALELHPAGACITGRLRALGTG